jgi:hypothetical protein
LISWSYSSVPNFPGTAGAAAGADKYAGLPAEMLTWRTGIVAADPLCKSTDKDKKCQGFEVACKAERPVTVDDQAKGVTARVVAAITYSGFDPKFGHAQDGASAAEFVKTAAGWTRSEHKPVNMSTCGDL